jgi:hypothetical protein
MALSSNTLAQSTKKAKAINKPVIDSAKWRVEHYVVDRDSAYTGP